MSSNPGCARSTLRQSILWTGAVAVLLVLSSLAFAQDSSTGNVSGTVTGPRGASVSGASITFTARITAQTVKTTTSPAGTYALRDLAPGEYILHVEAKGFQPADLLIRIQPARDLYRRRQTTARGGGGTGAGQYRDSRSSRRDFLQPDGRGSQRSRFPGFEPARTRSSVA